jgi:hypothetical protein
MAAVIANSSTGRPSAVSGMAKAVAYKVAVLNPLTGMISPFNIPGPGLAALQAGVCEGEYFSQVCDCR